jgi:hypothetical protein
MKERFRRAFLATTFPGFGETTRKGAQLIILRIEAIARGGYNSHLSLGIAEIEDLGVGAWVVVLEVVVLIEGRDDGSFKKRKSKF